MKAEKKYNPLKWEKELKALGDKLYKRVQEFYKKLEKDRE